MQDGFTFSDGQLLSLTQPKGIRRRILCPRTNPLDPRSPEAFIDTPKLAAKAFDLWVATLPLEEVARLASLQSVDHGHNPNVISYGFSPQQLEDLPPVDLWVHHAAVERTLAATNGSDRHKKSRSKLAAAKAEMRRRLWNTP